ncbi:hypothetical protein LCGC14_0855450 [marine sediment metagenome]|uniref:Gamma-glutamylcyclotransferase AIG2-like domain-containing protein n=1 Tax=marine sediment metagenome TaxID=412755 RepID=A0A0F9SG31_9ZZZZ
MDKIFVYGKLKDGNTKAWCIPKPGTVKHRLYGHKMYLRSSGTAGVTKGDQSDYIDGEIKMLRWPILQKLLIDLNEGTFWGVYKRKKIKIGQKDVWIYLYNRPTKGYKKITNWAEQHGEHNG